MSVAANAAPTEALALSEVRAHAAAALAPLTDTDPEVHADLVDSCTPPALLLFWADPWLNRRTVGGRAVGGTGFWDAWLQVLCLAGRIDASTGLEDLEQLVEYTIRRLQADGNTWPAETFYAPRRFDIGGITYLGARMVFRVPVTV